MAFQKKSNLEDPVQDTENEEKSLAGEIQAGEDAFSDMAPMPQQTARGRKPFDGFPMKKINAGEYPEVVFKDGKHTKTGKMLPLIVWAHSVVGLNPTEYVHQDPSNKNITQTLKDGSERMVDYETFHNRCVRDGRGQNIDIVFDRTLTLESGKVLTRVAIVDDHIARCQLFFKINQRTGKVEVDNRYVMLDKRQSGELLKTFNAVYYQQTHNERAAEDFYQEPASSAQ